MSLLGDLIRYLEGTVKAMMIDPGQQAAPHLPEGKFKGQRKNFSEKRKFLMKVDFSFFQIECSLKNCFAAICSSRIRKHS